MSRALRPRQFDHVPPSVLFGEPYIDRFGMSEEALQVSAITATTVAGALSAVCYSSYKDVFQFNQFLKNWKRNTLSMSNPMQILSEQNFGAIVDLGEKVAPLILQELHSQPSLLFVALERIFNENPVALEHRGDIAAMTDDWLSWGARRGLARF